VVRVGVGDAGVEEFLAGAWPVVGDFGEAAAEDA
jgi:hypothetical protein